MSGILVALKSPFRSGFNAAVYPYWNRVRGYVYTPYVQSVCIYTVRTVGVCMRYIQFVYMQYVQFVYAVRTVGTRRVLVKVNNWR